MNASLHSIVSSKIHNIYLIKYKLANGDEYYGDELKTKKGVAENGNVWREYVRYVSNFIMV